MGNKLADMMHRKLQERLRSNQSMNDLNLTFDINLLFIEEVTYKCSLMTINKTG